MTDHEYRDIGFVDGRRPLARQLGLPRSVDLDREAARVLEEGTQPLPIGEIYLGTDRVTVSVESRPLVLEMAEPDHDFAELQRRRHEEADLNLRLMEAGAARIVANPTGRGVEIQLDRRKIRDPALEAELIRQRVNARLTAQGVGPRLMGARSPGPAAVAEVIHRVRDCPDCAAGKHGNCDGSAWCTTCDTQELCPCAQVDHQ